MPVLYFDNFRGFSATFLQLKDVNFFVGENSTGKTSVLKLIGILSSQGFWRYGEFGKDETSLGGFEDIITYPRHLQEHFEVGIYNDEANKNEFAIKLKFIERENFPFLKEICLCNHQVNLQAIIDGSFLKFRYEINSNNVFGKSEFKEWIKDNGLNEKEFSKTEIRFKGILPTLTELRLALSNNSVIANSLSGALTNPFLFPFAWISPNRAEPQRIYYHQGLIPSAEGRHSASVLKEILEGKNVKTILSRFGTDSGLYDDITIRDLSGQLNAFEILVSVNGVARNIINVGFGVSQVLPIVIESIARDDNTWFAMQQPEVHLHPRAQAALGDFIFKSNTKDGQKFIIETHSDYLIDRFRLRLNRALREGQNGTDNLAQVIFFDKQPKGNQLTVIELNEDGAYPEEQPKAFRDFFITEQLELISI